MTLLLYIITNLFYYVLKLMFLFCFCLVSIVAINVSVQHDGGFLPGIILLTQ